MGNTATYTPPHERLALTHAAFVVVACAWLLGGIGTRSEWIVAALASPAFLLLFAELRARIRAHDRDGVHRMARWVSPLLGLSVLIIISALNPSHREAFIYDGYVLRPVPHLTWVPASANPAGSLRILACFGSLLATGLSVAFCVQSRSALRTLMLVLALHALGLSVIGTLQSQTHATGPIFGAFPAVNSAWFATFLYHNHWGAFAVLHVSATLALVFHSLRQPPVRGWLHGPGPLLGVVAATVAATAPLSSSRSTTVLMGLLILCATCLAFRHLLRVSRRRGSPRSALIGGGLLLLLTTTVTGLISYQSREIIHTRIAATLKQISDLQSGDAIYTRADLYADTWRMAADRPVFGWGLETYGPIFLHYSTFKPGRDGLINTFVDAHSDWLQSLAEIGFVGTALLIACAAIPLAETFRPRRVSAFSGWLLGGCALIAAYAWVEFPFANPAVVATWWICFFAAIRTLQLSPTGNDPFDAPVQHPAPLA